MTERGDAGVDVGDRVVGLPGRVGHGASVGCEARTPGESRREESWLVFASACSRRRVGRWSWSRIPDAGRKWAKCRDTALLAEQLGYDSIWVYDHFHNVPTPAHEAVFECWTVMAALAEATSTIRLGQMVSCTSYRPPTLTAKITSSDRRDLRWPARVGCRRRVVRPRVQGVRLRVPVAPKVRIGMLREAVEIVTAMWREPDTTTRASTTPVRGRAV